MSFDFAEDKHRIREIVDQWVVYSDAGDWDRFAALWHDDGYMSATWFQAPAAEFVRRRREGWEKGVSIIHFLGAHTADISGNRAIAQTKMTIGQRAPVHDIVCDVLCTGRFYDFLEKRDGDWGFVRR
ncbi:MAG TPA: nuclear transport factor 2 family protein, partial [Gammaproteobacteria bacterium]